MKTTLTFALTLLIYSANGCTCGDHKKKDLMEHSDFVIIIKVLGYFNRDGIPSFGTNPDIKAKVIRTLKGIVTSEEIVIISSVSGSCFRDFVIGQKYLVGGSQSLDDYYERNKENEMNDTEIELSDLEDFDYYISRITKDTFYLFTSYCEVNKR